jgi:hypothetical protein
VVRVDFGWLPSLGASLTRLSSRRQEAERVRSQDAYHRARRQRQRRASTVRSSRRGFEALPGRGVKANGERAASGEPGCDPIHLVGPRGPREEQESERLRELDVAVFGVGWRRACLLTTV